MELVLLLTFPGGHFPRGSSTKIVYTFLDSFQDICPAHIHLHEFATLTVLGGDLCKV